MDASRIYQASRNINTNRNLSHRIDAKKHLSPSPPNLMYFHFREGVCTYHQHSQTNTLFIALDIKATSSCAHGIRGIRMGNGAQQEYGHASFCLSFSHPSCLALPASMPCLPACQPAMPNFSLCSISFFRFIKTKPTTKTGKKDEPDQTTRTRPDQTRPWYPVL